MQIEFIVPTYNRYDQLVSMLSSLMAQISKNWLATIVVDDFENDNVKNIVKKFNSDKIKYIFTNKRYNDFGHTPREIGKQQAIGDYIIMTGDDNYYVPSFVQEFENKIYENNNPGMVYCNMLHNVYDYNPFNCTIVDGRIDMGAFATRIDLAQNLELGKEYAADAYFVMNFYKKYTTEKIIKIEKILFIHN